MFEINANWFEPVLDLANATMSGDAADRAMERVADLSFKGDVWPNRWKVHPPLVSRDIEKHASDLRSLIASGIQYADSREAHRSTTAGSRTKLTPAEVDRAIRVASRRAPLPSDVIEAFHRNPTVALRRELDVIAERNAYLWALYERTHKPSRPASLSIVDYFQMDGFDSSKPILLEWRATRIDQWYAMALVILVYSELISRLTICELPSCGRCFLAKNRTGGRKRYCTTNHGSQHRMQRKRMRDSQ